MSCSLSVPMSRLLNLLADAIQTWQLGRGLQGDEVVVFRENGRWWKSAELPPARGCGHVALVTQTTKILGLSWMFPMQTSRFVLNLNLYMFKKKNKTHLKKMRFLKNDSISIEEANKQKPLENKRKIGNGVIV